MTTRIYLHALLETIASLAAKLEPQRPLVDRGWFGFSRPLATWATSHLTGAFSPCLSGEGGHAADPRPREHWKVNSGCRKDPDSAGESKAEASAQFNTRRFIWCRHRWDGGKYRKPSAGLGLVGGDQR